MQTDINQPVTRFSAADHPEPAKLSANLEATAPGKLRVIKRNGTVVPYDDSKISVAITKAYLAVEGGNAAASSRIHETVDRLTELVSATFKRRMPSGGTMHIEDIQDQVELALMRSGAHKIARDYVIYREQRARQRAQSAAAQNAAAARQPEKDIRVTLADGSRAPLDIERIRTVVREACAGLDDVTEADIIDEALRNLYDGVSQKELSDSLVITARTLIEKEPNYSYAAARLLLDNLRAEALGFLGVTGSATQEQMKKLYAEALPVYIDRGVELELLEPKLRGYDMDRLGQALLPERDLQFTYLGLQTLYDRYFPAHPVTACASNSRRRSSCAWRWGCRSTRSRARSPRAIEFYQRTVELSTIMSFDTDPVQFRYPAFADCRAAISLRYRTTSKASTTPFKRKRAAVKICRWIG